MADGLGILTATAFSIGLLHTLLGPDHYLPFIAMARAGRWSLTKTVLVTVLCGLGHVLSSVLLGLGGIAFGVAVLRLEHIEALRGDIAGWLMVAFGSVYLVWGLRRALRNRPHTHLHAHAGGAVHAHVHVHHDEHLHVHAEKREACAAGDGPVTSRTPRASNHGADRAGSTHMTPWVLFCIFLFGPCEPLIPLLMYPAAAGPIWGVAWVTAVFGVTTIATMTIVVLAAYLGAAAIPVARFERYSHAMAGFAVLACGLALKAGL